MAAKDRISNALISCAERIPPAPWPYTDRGYNTILVWQRNKYPAPCAENGTPSTGIFLLDHSLSVVIIDCIETRRDETRHAYDGYIFAN